MTFTIAFVLRKTLSPGTAGVWKSIGKMADMFLTAWLLANRERRVFREHGDAFDLSDARFVGEYRLSKDAVRWLCEELRPTLQPRRETVYSMSVEQKVLCALRFYAAGGYQGTVASDQNLAVGQSTVSRVITEVTDAILERLLPWIRFPQSDEEKAIVKRGFCIVGGMDGVIGCIDGTQIAIKGPSENDRRFNKPSYWCRKMYYAINAMIVCDAKLKILSIDATYPGSSHDAFIWRYSSLRAAFDDGLLVGPDEFLLGDSGYPLEPWLLTPVAGNHRRGTSEAVFNRVHRSTRSIVERCIGMLKNRFRCLQRYRALHYNPRKASNIITACAILHNICLSWNVDEPVADLEELSASTPNDGSDDDSTPSTAPTSSSASTPPNGGSYRARGLALRTKKMAELSSAL